jgi:hypothetical protein
VRLNVRCRSFKALYHLSKKKMKNRLSLFIMFYVIDANESDSTSNKNLAK